MMSMVRLSLIAAHGTVSVVRGVDIVHNLLAAS